MDPNYVISFFYTIISHKLCAWRCFVGAWMGYKPHSYLNHRLGIHIFLSVKAVVQVVLPM